MQWKREYAAKNPQRVRSWYLKSYVKHSGKRKDYQRKYRTEINPELAREFSRSKRARKRMAVGVHTLQQWMWRVRFYGWGCFFFNTSPPPQTITQNHPLPPSPRCSNLSPQPPPPLKY